MLTFLFTILSQDGRKSLSIWRQQEQVSMRTSRNNLYKKTKYSKFSFYCSINTNFNNWTRRRLDMRPWQNEMSWRLQISKYWSRRLRYIRLGENVSGISLWGGCLQESGFRILVPTKLFFLWKTFMKIQSVILHSSNSSSCPGAAGRRRRGGWSRWWGGGGGWAGPRWGWGGGRRSPPWRRWWWRGWWGRAGGRRSSATRPFRPPNHTWPGIKNCQGHSPQQCTSSSSGSITFLRISRPTAVSVIIGLKWQSRVPTWWRNVSGGGNEAAFGKDEPEKKESIFMVGA